MNKSLYFQTNNKKQKEVFWVLLKALKTGELLDVLQGSFYDIYTYELGNKIYQYEENTETGLPYSITQFN